MVSNKLRKLRAQARDNKSQEEESHQGNPAATASTTPSSRSQAADPLCERLQGFEALCYRVLAPLKPGLSNKKKGEAHASQKELVRALEPLLLEAVGGMARGDHQASDVLYTWTVCKFGLELQDADISQEGKVLHARVRSEVNKRCNVNIDSIRAHLEQQLLRVGQEQATMGSGDNLIWTDDGHSPVRPLSDDPGNASTDPSGRSAAPGPGNHESQHARPTCLDSPSSREPSVEDLREKLPMKTTFGQLAEGCGLSAIEDGCSTLSVSNFDGSKPFTSVPALK
ncbi:hypothetical protein QFC20_007646 [Naganishia adeliensis]|uniref:Uncharacterized protein n=1 Tax=Naganishia adeliensis TaxID=92952 RepID=A0ACC2UWA0_9TREE|nr:hypothetical protein QFC20_007646 [Naganishia adeliensis]